MFPGPREDNPLLEASPDWEEVRPPSAATCRETAVIRNSGRHREAEATRVKVIVAVSHHQVPLVVNHPQVLLVVAVPEST